MNPLGDPKIHQLSTRGLFVVQIRPLAFQYIANLRVSPPLIGWRSQPRFLIIVW